MERTEAEAIARRMTETFGYKAEAVATRRLAFDLRIANSAGVRRWSLIREAIRETPRGAKKTRSQRT
ncbi:MAG: hypothetical protein ACFB6S_06810 [Geminicoccaceae bacterium]